MTDLQLGLLVVGVAAVAAVLVYNRVQEGKVRREAQRAFASGHADTLLGDRPPQSPEQAASAWKPARQAEGRPGDMPDPRLDYVIDLEVGRGTLSATVLENWKPIELRFLRRALLAAGDGDGWRRVVAGDVRSLTALRAALQLVSRSGVIAEAELLEFRSAVETLAAALGARIACPEMRPALEAATELDGLCAEADIQVALHVVGGQPQVAESSGEPYQIEPRSDGVSLILDVPRTADPSRAFEAMARAARQLAAAGGGRVVDDNGTELDERALRAIETELAAVAARLAHAGIEPGSGLALRLFS